MTNVEFFICRLNDMASVCVELIHAPFQKQQGTGREIDELEDRKEN